MAEHHAVLECPRIGANGDQLAKVSMHYQRYSTSPIHNDSTVPTLVFVHGFGCDHTDWGRQSDFFIRQQKQKRFNVIAADLVGHGKSALDTDESNLSSSFMRVEHLGADVAHLLSELGITNAYLVGHSLGCRVVLEAWRKAKNRIVGAVLIDGSYRAASAEDDPTEVEAKAYQSMSGDDFEPVVRPMFQDMFESDSIFSREEQDCIISRALKLGEQRGATLYASAVAWDFLHMSGTLAELNGKLLVIQSTFVDAQGKRSKLQPQSEEAESSSWLQLIQDQAPAARIEIVPSGHFVMMEESETVNQILFDFVKQN